jgi:hypothetical protein
MIFTYNTQGIVVRAGNIDNIRNPVISECSSSASKWVRKFSYIRTVVEGWYSNYCIVSTWLNCRCVKWHIYLSERRNRFIRLLMEINKLQMTAPKNTWVQGKYFKEEKMMWLPEVLRSDVTMYFTQSVLKYYEFTSVTLFYNAKPRFLFCTVQSS